MEYFFLVEEKQLGRCLSTIVHFLPHLKKTKQTTSGFPHASCSFLPDGVWAPCHSFLRPGGSSPPTTPSDQQYFVFLFCGASFKVLSAQAGFSAPCNVLTCAVFWPGLPLYEAFYSGRRGAKLSEDLFTDPPDKPASYSFMQGWLWKTKLLSPSSLQGAIDCCHIERYRCFIWIMHLFFFLCFLFKMLTEGCCWRDGWNTSSNSGKC